MKNRCIAFWMPLVMVAALGCENAAPSITSNAKPASAAASPNAVPPSKEMLVRLQAADKLDGDEDQIVHRCYVCSLGMDGKEKHSAKFGEYTAHLCSQGCLDEFQADPAKVVAETEIPKESESKGN